MDENAGYVELIRRAQFGDQDSMNRLAELVEPRLLVYLYRLTVNYDLAQDLMQDTMLKMVESLNEVKQPERFWHWLFRTALGKVQHYYRDRRRERVAEISALSKERLSQHIWEEHDDGLSHVMRRELSESVCRAMADLKVIYRNILILRCYEQMSYAEIAGVMDCKELRARVLFFRARHALKRHLSLNGFSKETLLTGLGLFGILTLSGKATSTACSVNTASMNVGLTAAMVGSLGTRLGIAIITSAGALLACITFRQVIISVIVVALILVGLIIAGLYFGLD